MEIHFLALFLAGAAGILMKLPPITIVHKSPELFCTGLKKSNGKERKNVYLVFTKQ
jgi:hypothetical protein